MSFYRWGLKVTGWSSINMYEWAVNFEGELWHGAVPNECNKKQRSHSSRVVVFFAVCG